MPQHIGGNAHAFERMASRLGMDSTSSWESGFFAGTMFWVRLEALRPLMDAHLGEWQFETEGGQIDGTLSHAVERIFCSLVAHACYEVALADAPDALFPAAKRYYPFVRTS
jgi:lipopolysaccharide biosynthesis protein